eukprot:TRINITY_DN1186_c0_g1_i2.p1 TRINITY_DN1186_c0_g1~~TRINITY_DN1186_c0_g1_i2.p1  ORF type:complete len:235 (-),score=37.83 TRINITY_DN1186_c0_g1_i2:11-715(-)
MFRLLRRNFSASTPQALRLTLLGAPGSGKGTQAEKIKKDFGCETISTGHLLREAVLQGTPLGKKVENIMKTGGLVEDSIMLDLVKSALSSKPKWLLDGYPRTVQQTNSLFKLLDEIHASLHAAIYIKVDQEVIIERIENRLVHPVSGRTYHKMYKPPKVPYKDDITGEDLIQRPDDTRESILFRLNQFNSYAEPILEIYKEKGILHVIPSPSSDVGYVHIHKMLTELCQKLDNK